MSAVYGLKRARERTERQEMEVLCDMEPPTITEPTACSERVVQATNVVVLINKLLNPQETI